MSTTTGEAKDTPTERAERPIEAALPWLGVAALNYAAIALLTLTPRRGRAHTNLVPFAPQVAGILGWMRGDVGPWAFVDLAGNVVLFVPFGISLALGLRALLGPRRFALPTTLVGCMGSVAIETAQLALASRATDITDVILNTLGAAASAWVVGRVLNDSPAADRTTGKFSCHEGAS
jgi:glycopeptide antibiotics resistance protein